MAGAQCCSNPPILNPSSGSGHLEKFGGLDSYVSGSPDSKLGILFISDILGFQAPKLRTFADKIAAAGYFVVVPDYFHGDPFVPGENGSFDHLPPWLKIHGPEKGFEDTKPIVEALKSKGISTIGAAGFCWGAKVVALLGKHGHDFIDAGVLLHPAFTTPDDIKAVKIPIAVLGAEHDHVTPPEVLKQFEEVLATKTEIKSYVKIFPNVEHGWTTRYNEEDEVSVKAAEEAHQDVLEWFLNHAK